MKNKEAEPVADQIVKHSMTFGIPDAVMSDQRKEFQCAVLKSVWELLDVHQLRTSPYYPQADGISQRFIRTLQDMLTHFFDTERSDWDLKMVHAVTKLTPFELIIGRKPKIPLELVY